jgi:uncharacterized protein DUF551
MAEWQAIESAAMDGTRVLGAEGAEIRIMRYEQINFRRIQGWWDVCSDQLIYPTHWMPLPDPPEVNK